MIIDFSNLLTFLVWYGITTMFLMLAHIFKKSILALIPVVYFIIILGITASNTAEIQDVLVHRIFNFTGFGFERLVLEK